MKLLRIFSLVLMVGIFLLASPVSTANETQAKIALQAAIADAKSRVEKTPDSRFAFKGVSRENLGTKNKNIDLDDEDIRSNIIFTYDPALPKSQQYQLLHPTDAENADDRKQALLERKTGLAVREKLENNKGDDQLLIFDLDDKDTGLDGINVAEYIKETDTDWVFSISPSTKDMNLDGLNDIDISGSDSEKPLSNKERKMMEKMKSRLPKFIKSVKGELRVDKTHKRLSGMRIYFSDSLKITTGIKLHKMEIITDLGPAWEGGPIVTRRITQKMQIKLFLIKVGMTDTTVYSNFEPREVSKEN
ncbi:MAG: hypothetical protein COA91_02680 [Robiginitomaculum sp.]|nr:MAG: hypothetical protein COA91_02680 [Robiginitomaculum sp.]